MTQVLKGVKVLEVAQFTFVPAAGAIMADWGADVVKIEHPVRGDTHFLGTSKLSYPLKRSLFEIRWWQYNRGENNVIAPNQICCVLSLTMNS